MKVQKAIARLVDKMDSFLSACRIAPSRPLSVLSSCYVFYIINQKAPNMVPSEAELNAGVVFGMGALNNDEVRSRPDIDVMIAKQPDVFNLFLLALMDLKADTSKLGYFQLAGESSSFAYSSLADLDLVGIHGLPATLWDGVGKDFPEDTGGYCAHGRLIFPTRHRPYLTLLEVERSRHF